MIQEKPAQPTYAIAVRATHGEVLVVWVLWLTYGAFYFCRTNISAAVPGMQEPVAAGGLGLDPVQIGLVLGSLKLAYGVGQLVNGQLAERLSPRLLLAIGMFGSAALNVVFGLAPGFYFLVFVWACNGYCQALGWTPCMRTAANWIPVSRRGRVIGILGTSYQLMAALTYVLAGWSAEWLGWRGAFYIPAVLLAAAGVHMLFLLRPSPEEIEPRLPTGNDPAGPKSTAPIWIDNLRSTLANPTLWLLAVTLFLLDACRYGYQDWGLKHLVDTQKSGVGIAALKYAVLPLGGALGAILAGWATDRLFGGRRLPVVCGLLILLGILTLLYEPIVRMSVAGTVVLLVAIGFAIFGPQVLLVGTAPADLARRGTAAAAAGLVNFMGYLGAFTGDWVTGSVVKYSGWPLAVLFWAACAFAAALVAACLWNARSPQAAAPRPAENQS